VPQRPVPLTTSVGYLFLFLDAYIHLNRLGDVVEVLE
jgi:hypothetical protein